MDMKKFGPMKVNIVRVGIGILAGTIIILGLVMWAADSWEKVQQNITGVSKEKAQLVKQLASINSQLTAVKNEDQYVKNTKLSRDIGNIETTYRTAVSVYEELLALKDVSKNTTKQDEAFADILTLLSKRDYTAASAALTALKTVIASERQKIAAAFVIPASVAASNTPPGSGYSRQTVTSDAGTNMVDVIAGDLSTTRVIVDTASNESCGNDCPVLSLSDYVSRNGAYAGINGAYFCPADYPSCAGKKNSFDTLLMNKNKVYFNSDNNKYSVVPAVIFGSGFIRFVGQSLEWGRDTGIDSMIANQPLLLSGGNVSFGGNDDPKMGSMGTRSFVASKGNTVYIGVVHNVSVAGMARVLKSLGMENALNLDSGGSVALWSGGYKAGPGRNIPNAILFVRK